MMGRCIWVNGLFLALSFSCLGQGPAIDLGTVNTAGGRKVIPVDFGRTSASLTQFAKAAFRLHGAYRLVQPMQGDYSFDFRAAGNGAVELDVSTGKPRKSLLRKTLHGAGSTQALLKACDEAVRATINVPGFFAGKLVYVSKREKGKELFVADTLFLRASQKTNYGAVCCNASWSTNGQGIFFTSDKRLFNDIYFMDLAARKLQRVAAFKGSNLRAVQNPVDRRVAYVLSVTGNPELWLASGIGARPKRITRNNSNESGPCWSPDGRRLIITSDLSGKPQLYEVALNSGRLTRIPTNLSRHCSEAAWNPRNPNRIAYTAAIGGGFQIAEYDVSLRKSRVLTSGSADALQPEWANDGRHIFFTERKRGATRLMILDAGSDEEARLTTHLKLAGSPDKETPRKSAMPQPVKLHDERFGNTSQASFYYE
jgi:TolB protein